jgi:hypothetical protein
VEHLGRFWRDVASEYNTHIVEAGKEAQLVILVSFLVTFAAVRIITHAIRAGRWTHVFHNLATKSGTHLHHLVPGIFLLLISGYIGIAVAPTEHRSWWAVGFGIGAALTLDEFALWLHLEDVYWAKQGRASVDAVVIAATVIALGILGWGFWAGLGGAVLDLIELLVGR